LEESEQTVGIQVVIGILNVGILPCAEAALNDFIPVLGRFLSSSYKVIYGLAAETFGMLLK